MLATTTCSECPASLDVSGPYRERETCSDRCRQRRRRRLRLAREERLMTEARERAEHLDYARSFLKRQTAAIIAGDQAALDALVAEADAYFATHGD